MYQCPRADLGCGERFRTTGDLDWHGHQVHGYRHGWRMVSSFGRKITLPIGPEPRRRVPDGLEDDSGMPTMGGMRASATAAESRSKHRGRGGSDADEKNGRDRREGREGRDGREKVPAGARAKHRPADAVPRAAKAARRGKHSASS